MTSTLASNSDRCGNVVESYQLAKGICTMIEVRMCVKSTQVSNSECLDNIQKCYRLPNLQNTRKSGLSHNHAMHSFHAIAPIILLFHESRPEKRANRIITSTCGGI